MAESYLKSEFTSLAGANVDAGVLRATIESNGIIVVALADGPTALRWIDDVADPTFEITFVSTLPAPQVTELDTLIAAHAGPSDVSQAMRVFFESTAPLVTDDSDKLFEIGDQWHDSSTSHVYILTDATIGAAVWLWTSGWGLSRPTDHTKFRASLQTGGESAPDVGNVIVTDGADDFDELGYGGTKDRGYFENFGAVTSATTPTLRMDESPTLLDGRYLIEWMCTVGGSSTATVSTATFKFDGGDIDSIITDASMKFSGFVERVVTAGAKSMQLEIDKDSGGGSAEMSQSSMRYTWIEAT